MSNAPSARPHTRWRFSVLFGAAGALIVGIVVLAFVWPAATAKARDLPVGIAGPAAQVDQLRDALRKQDPSPFDLVTVDSRADAVQAIRERRLYGAVLLGDSPEVLTSSASSTVANQALRGVATSLQARVSAGVEQGLVGKLQQTGKAITGLQKEVAGLQKEVAGLRTALRTGDRSAAASSDAPSGSGASTRSSAGSAAPPTDSRALPTVRITDVVALASTDPTGAGLSAAAFPLVLGGVLGGVLVSLLVVGVVRRLLALTVYGLGAGAVVTTILQTWLGVLQRDWLTNAGAFALAMAATAALVVGCNSLLGPRGIAVGAVISTLIGNPISGATLPYQFIAGSWGEVGQWFVPGAASSLIRSLSYFPDADVSAQWWTLAAWAAGGALLTVVGHFRSAAPVPLPAAELEPERIPVAA